MWLFTSIGFFSAVQKQGEKEITIRARAAGDLDRLRKLFMPALGPTVANAGTDYPYRARIARAEFAEGLAKIGESIDYSNFKDEVQARMGSARAHTYHNVWKALAEIEREKDANQSERRRNT